jgi:hypothetical protein
MLPWQPRLNVSPKFWNLKYTQLTSFPVNIEVIYESHDTNKVPGRSSSSSKYKSFI